MTIQEKYQAIGESFDDVIMRLSKEDRIERFAAGFFTTGDFEALEKSILENDIPNVFEYSHRMKGNSLNIGFIKFADTIDELVEFVRPKKVSDKDKLMRLFETVKKDYEKLKSVFE